MLTVNLRKRYATVTPSREGDRGTFACSVLVRVGAVALSN
jgi:hypothetical protein